MWFCSGLHGYSTGSYLLEKIQDSAGQKGTGKWTAVAGLEYGIPVTLIGESVFARCLSSLLDERKHASSILKGPPSSKYTGDKKQFLEHIRQAGHTVKLSSVHTYLYTHLIFYNFFPFFFCPPLFLQFVLRFTLLNGPKYICGCVF